MTLLWTITATFLYAEIVFCLILLLPIISPSKWRTLFKSRALAFICSYANLYFGLFLVLLAIMFFDAVRDVRRFSGTLSSDELKGSPLAENTQHMKLFRAQRNLYIAGFSIFLFIVLRRVVVLLNELALIQADCTAAKKQAASASATAKTLIDNQDNANIQEGIAVKETLAKLEELKKENAILKDELNHSKANENAVKSQAQSTNREYDRLLKEVEKLQKQLALAQGGSEGKKTE